MYEVIISGLVGGIAGAFTSGLIYWLLDKRRENKEHRKVKQCYKDIISFLNKLDDFRKDKDNIEKFIKELGIYRINKINHAISEMNILNLKQTGNSEYVQVIKNGFHNYSKEDLKEIIKDVKKGVYDEYF